MARGRKRDDVITPSEIAQRLKLGINQVYAGFRAGELPARKVGKRWIVPRVQFERFLAGDEPREPAE
jgi:excisionase family DNA binding protein